MTFSGYGKYKYVGNMGRENNASGYKGFRVKSVVKSFRDLEVYQKTTEISSKLFLLSVPKKTETDFSSELVMLRNISKQIPRLIAESYGDKWNSKEMAMQKLETAMRYISDIIAKLDFLVMVIKDDQACKELRLELMDALKKYQKQRFKIRNLKKAWERIR